MTQESEQGDIFKDLGDIDFSKLDEGKGAQYTPIPPDEISRTFEYYPLKGPLMNMANENLRDAQAQAEGLEIREKGYHDKGWELSIQTPNGIVGLSSSWLGTRFYLGYPKEFLPPRTQVTDKLITTILGVEKADVLSAGSWGRFYGPLEPNGGRVWFDYDRNSTGARFPNTTDGELQEVYYWHPTANGVTNYPYSEYSQDTSEDAPTAAEEAVQRYRDRFILLASEIAFLIGGARAININYGFVLVPEDLDREGYGGVSFLKGDWGIREGGGRELVRGQRGDSTIILQSGNSLVPWSTILRAPVNGRITSPTTLADFIKEDILWF